MPSNVELKHFSVGQMDNNVYILIDPDTGESVLIDAPTDATRILRELNGTKCKYILMTHSDGDHIQALKEVKAKTGAQIAAHPEAATALPVASDIALSDGQTLSFGTHDIVALYTPGHAPGHMSFVLDKMVFDGDTLFPGGPGNTDRPDGDFDTIVESIRSRLFTLPDDTTVYPGHGKSTTIGAERPNLPEWIKRGW